MLDLGPRLEITDGGYLRGQAVQARSDLCSVGGGNVLLELEQDCIY